MVPIVELYLCDFASFDILIFSWAAIFYYFELR